METSSGDYEGWYCIVDGKSFVRCEGSREEAWVVESIGLGIRFELSDETRLERVALVSEMSENLFLRTYCGDGMVGDRCILSLIGYEEFSQYLDTSNDLRGTLSFSQEDRLHYFYRIWVQSIDDGDEEMERAVSHLLVVSDRFGVRVCDDSFDADDSVRMSGTSYMHS